MSNPVFLLAAGSAVALALAFVVWPLRGGRQRLAMIGLLIFVPVATAALYLQVGTPAAISPDTGQTGEIRAAVTRLADQAMREPDRAEHWARLGLAYKSLQEFGSAEHAFRRALYIDGDSAFLKAELGETLLYASGDRRLPNEARQLLEQAAEGDSQKALWLLGLDAHQRENPAEAADRFEHLLATLPADSEIRPTVEQYLAAARSGSAAARRVAPETSSAAAGGPTLSISVDIAPELADKLGGNETVFVIVRQAGSAGPPLAARRLAAGDLPARLAFDDTDAMMAGAGLSSAGAVEVTARVSFSGQTTPADGDFEGHAGPVPVASQMEATVHIDQVR